jgi:hypothetical protein
MEPDQLQHTWLKNPLTDFRLGISAPRKAARIQEVLLKLSATADPKTEAQQAYVRSEEFKDLLERTLLQAAGELDQEKRAMYGAFLAGAINSPGGIMHTERLRMLRLFEQIHADHLQLFRALAAKPDYWIPREDGTYIDVLQDRLPSMKEEQIRELVEQLNSLQVASLPPQALGIPRPWIECQKLWRFITPFGQHLLPYLL